MARMLGLSDQLLGIDAFNKALVGDGAGERTVDKSKGELESERECKSDTPLPSPAAVVTEHGPESGSEPSGLISASGCHDSKDFDGGARPGGGDGCGFQLMQDGN